MEMTSPMSSACDAGFFMRQLDVSKEMQWGQSITPDLGPRRGGAEERTGPGGPLLCIRYSEDLVWDFQTDKILRSAL